MVKERANHLPAVLFTKYNMGADKPVLVIILPPVRFIGAPTRQGIIVSIQGDCYPERSVAMITTVGVPVGYPLDDIGMNARKVVIHMECNGEASWVKLLGEI